MEGYIAEIRLFAPNFAPKYWAFCYGQILPINTNQALFSLLGTTYGGNGVTTFALPDLRGRTPMGTGTPVDLPACVLGQIQGNNSVTVLSSNLPAHTHSGVNEYTMGAYSDEGNKGSPTGNNIAALPALFSKKAADTTLRPFAPAITINTAGGSQALPVQQPYLGLNYIICLYGIFPSRN
ncbi:phage tail protein [Flavobacterium hungaricum]|uniref:Phage tail protein n=1 Tax=Flavobacterium hungaricum TaxID=2082725 RepID=A0ABR9TSK0_9FLAO|nr:tail fiber protein [Flavobacterium hungaricum]MBE8728303.1 phage tail protein [Flavobacterium hungaricum]